MTDRRRYQTTFALLPLLLVAGCGGSAGSASDPAATTQAPPLKLLHTFEEHGDQPRGRYHAIQLVGTQVMAGTEDGVEMFTYDPASGFTATTHHALSASPASKSKVHRIRAGRGDDLWVSTSDGVARFVGTEFKVQEQSGPARDAADFQGVVWIARSNGLEVYEPELPKLSEMPIMLRDGSETSDLTGTRQPMSLVSAAADTLFVGCQFGMLQVTHTGTSLSWRHHYGSWDRVAGNSVIPQDGNSALPGNRVYNLRVSPDGSQLAACTDGGLALVDLPDLKDWKVYQGMHRVNRSDPIKGIYHEEVPGNVEMPSSDVHDVAFGPKRLFLGTSKGLVLVSREGPKAMPAQVVGLDDGLPSSRVTGLAVDEARRILFVATGYGLAAFQLP